MGAEMTF